MHRVKTGIFRACFAIGALLWAAGAFSQQTAVISISAQTQAVDDVLRRGRQLELERRWGDALTQYEDAVRQFPGETILQRRYDATRLHYDVQRRYADRSFNEVLLKLSLDRSLDLYSQVLLKIESHYVDAQDWRAIADRGLSGFEAALNEPSFLDHNVPQANRASTTQCVRELRNILSTRDIGSRQDVRDAAAFSANYASRRLGTPATAVVFEYLCGATNGLDQYSAYLTPDQLSEVYSQIEGNFVGVGIELKSQGTGLSIVRVIPGSPAEESGVRAGDRIVAVDGTDTTKLSNDQAANLLQGEEGSTVTFSVIGSDNSHRQMSVRRRRVDVPSVDQVAIIDKERGIGYCRLTCFQKTTARDLDVALWKLNREGMRSLIIDVRGNPGGLLMSAVDVADRFIDSGLIVSTKGRNPQEDASFSAHAEGTWRMPLAVIVDQDSASAAEIFSGAVKDSHRGTVIGVRSYGKGSVQGIFPLEGTNAGLRLTTAKFYSPTGKPYSHVGVEPDVVVRQAAKPIDGQIATTPNSADDQTLATAMSVIRGDNRSTPLQARSTR